MLERGSLQACKDKEKADRPFLWYMSFEPEPSDSIVGNIQKIKSHPTALTCGCLSTGTALSLLNSSSRITDTRQAICVGRCVSIHKAQGSKQGLRNESRPFITCDFSNCKLHHKGLRTNPKEILSLDISIYFQLILHCGRIFKPQLPPSWFPRKSQLCSKVLEKKLTI